jgi:hypothetical protein
MSGFRTTGSGHYDDLDEVRTRQERCGWPRWSGDPHPAALVEKRVAEAALGNAWQAVAEAAQLNANGVRIGRQAGTSRADLLRLIDAARALEPAVHEARVAARRAEDARPPKRKACAS